jgi:hypothetical protein
MRMRATLGVLLCLLAGCSGFYPPDQPDWIVNRLPLEPCGVETLDSTDATPWDAEARTCLLEAYVSGDPAELISTATTEEGDAITHYYRVHENGTVEIFVDATAGRFGSQRWERYRCDRLVRTNEDQVFVEEDCEELPIP